MKPYTSLKSILAEFFPLHRTLASDEHDKTLEIVGERCGLKSSLSTWKPFGLAQRVRFSGLSRTEGGIYPARTNAGKETVKGI